MHYRLTENTGIYLFMYPFDQIGKLSQTDVCPTSRLGATSDKRKSDLYVAIIWWRHDMETLSAVLALCEGNPPVNGEFPSHRARTANFDIFLFFPA